MQQAACGIVTTGHSPQQRTRHTTVSQYSIGADGALTPTGSVAAGVCPESITVDPVERRVLQGGLLMGLSEWEIATARGQGDQTVHEYIVSIFQKFGVNDTAAAALMVAGASAVSPLYLGGSVTPAAKA